MMPRLTTPRSWLRLGSLSVLLTVLLVASVAEAITVEEIVTLSKLGVQPSEIIAQIDKDRTVFHLQTAQILELRRQGVDDAVIRHMMETPKLFGAPKAPTGGGAAPAGTPSPGATAAPAAPSPQQRAAEEARRRQEQRRIAEMARRMREQKMLKEAQELAEDGEWVAALHKYQEFLQRGHFPPQSEQAYMAKYGMANALMEAGLLYSAAPLLTDVLLEGPKRPFFEPALRKMRDLRRAIDYAPPSLQQLREMYVGDRSQEFQDLFNFFVGEFFFSFNDHATAVQFLDHVSDSSPDYARAVYLKGLYQVENKLYRSALQSFQQAIVATERNGSNPVVADLAYLALARIGFESGNYDAAVYYYRKIRSDSPKLPVAFYELAWAYFMKGDYSRALGAFQALQSPYFAHYFFPELWVLEATVYLNTCHYDLTEEALNRFKETVLVLQEPLKRFFQGIRRPTDLYEAIVQTVSGAKKRLPQEAVHYVLSDPDFYRLYTTLRQVEWERQEMGREAPKLGPLGARLQATLERAQNEAVNKLGIKIQQLLKQLQGEIEHYATKMLEIQIDLDNEKSQQLERQIQALGGGATKKKKAAPQVTGSIAVVGADSMEWPFEGEYWKDELQYYRSFLRSRCKE